MKFSNDTKLMREAAISEERATLQEVQNRLEEWAKNNCKGLEPGKT